MQTGMCFAGSLACVSYADAGCPVRLADQGMVEEGRTCRDVLFLLLFIAYWAGMFVVCGFAFQKGEGRQKVAGSKWC